MGFTDEPAICYRTAGFHSSKHEHYRHLRKIVVWFMMVIASVSISACSSAPVPGLKNTAQKYWPTLPDRPRYIHEATLRHVDDIVRKTSADRLRNRVLGEAQKQAAFLRPYDIAANYGRIYISDTDAAAISVFDIPRRHFYQMGIRLGGKLIKPMGLALDAQSNLYVADIGSKRIQVFDFLGLHLRTIGIHDNLQQPMSVAVDRKNQRLYVVDHGGIDSEFHRVLVYNLEGERLRTIGQRGHRPGEFNLPTDAVVGEDGTLYVLDSGNFRVQIFSPSGDFLDAWGTAGSGFGQFARPRSIAVDAQQNLYITDMFFGNFQVFNRQGQLLLPIGKLNETDMPGLYRLISGITVDETQRVYVVDQFFKKVDVFRYLHPQESERLVRMNENISHR